MDNEVYYLPVKCRLEYELKSRFLDDGVYLSASCEPTLPLFVLYCDDETGMLL